MQVYARLNERALERDIAEIDHRMAVRPDTGGMRSRCATAYLRALRESKRDSLAQLKVQRETPPS